MGNDSILSNLLINIVAAVLVLILTSIANASLGSAPARPERPFIAPLVLVVLIGIVAWSVLTIKDSKTLALINSSSPGAGPITVVPEPAITFFPPSAWTPTHTPTHTPPATPSPSPSATPTTTRTATPTWSPSPTSTATIEAVDSSIDTPTATPSLTNTPTPPPPPIEITNRSDTCLDENFNARITDAVIEIVSATSGDQVAYVTLYGVATRNDFTEYRMYWSRAVSSGQAVEAAPEDVYEFYEGKGYPGQRPFPVLQTRPLSELTRPREYRLTLRVFGRNDGQYQECQVLVKLR